MAMSKRFPVRHGDVFPHGAYVVSEVTPVSDYDRSTKERPVQQVDKDSGLPLWSVEVLDADPEAGKKNRTVSVKIAAKHQPVPPEVPAGTPFAPVEFEGLSALPYIDDSGNFARIAWSFKATDLHAPGKKSPNATGASPCGSSSAAA
jgi:hypothetical protein